jgi:hypothetical protein
MRAETTVALGLAATMDYQTVFDVAKAASQFTTESYKHLPLVYIALPLLVFGAILAALRHYLSGIALAIAFGFVTFVFACTLAAVWFVPNLATSTRSVAPKVITGTVRDFVPMPVTGHAMERFCVQTACFQYSDYVLTGGFNNASSHGGPIEEGRSVRVTYLEHASWPGNVIIKLEIER